MKPAIKLIKMRVDCRIAAFLTLAIAGAVPALPAWGDEVSGLSREDSLDANVAFASGFQLQQFEAHRHLYTDNRPHGSFQDYADEENRPREKLPAEWLAGLSMFRSDLPAKSASGSLLTDESLAFHLGADIWVADQLQFGIDGGIQNTPEEDFNQGLFHTWFEFVFPLRSTNFGKGPADETAKEYYDRMKQSRDILKTPASGIYPQLRVGGKFSFLRHDKGPDELGRTLTPLQSHVILNQSENTGILSFYPSSAAELWAGFTKNYYDGDPNQLLAVSQFGTRVPSALALGLLENFSDLMQAFPNYGIKGGATFELGPSVDLQGAVVYDNYQLSTLTSTLSFGAMLHFRLGSSFKLGVGGDRTSASGVGTTGSTTTVAVGLGYYL